MPAVIQQCVKCRIGYCIYGNFSYGESGERPSLRFWPRESALYWALVISLQSIQSFVLPEKELHVSPAFAMGMFEHGVSMGLMSAIYNIGSVVLQSSINALGSVYIAAQVGGRRLAENVLCSGSGFGNQYCYLQQPELRRRDQKPDQKGIVTAIWMYGVWWLIALGFTIFLCTGGCKIYYRNG